MSSKLSTCSSTQDGDYKLSLWAAILITMNVMMGVGLFVNTTLLARLLGAYGVLAYIVVGIVLFPLALTFFKLLRIYSGGTFYDFAKSIHPSVGLIAGFGYFLAKMASCSLCIHVFVLFLKQLLPGLISVPTLFLDACVIALFALCNMRNLRTGERIQYGFLALKLIPVGAAIIAGIIFFKPSTFTTIISNTLPINGLIVSFPFVLYAFTGFEACCAISYKIKGAERNAPKALILSYLAGVLIVTLYQFLIYTALGSELAHMSDYSHVFSALATKFFPQHLWFKDVAQVIFSIGIAASSLGGAYGMMYSNIWNFFVLARNKHVPFWGAFVRLNKYGTPTLVVLLEALFVLFFVLFSRGSQVPIQQISSTGMITAYITSVIALLVYEFKNGITRALWVPLLSFLSCFIFVLSFFKNLRLYSPLPVIIYFIILGLVLLFYWLKLAYFKCHKCENTQDN